MIDIMWLCLADKGVAALVKGTIGQGDLCSRGQMSKGLLPKETYEQPLMSQSCTLDKSLL